MDTPLFCNGFRSLPPLQHSRRRPCRPGRTLQGRIDMRRTRLLPLIAFAALGGCDLSGPDFGPPADMQRSALPATLVVGQTVEEDLRPGDHPDEARIRRSDHREGPG